MPDPATLPPELFDSILEYLSPDVSVAPALVRYDHKWDQLADLTACNLVSRAWYTCALPKLYRAFRFQAHEHSFWRLWKFVRTTIENSKLAALVQYLDLGEFYECDNLTMKIAKRKAEITQEEKISQKEDRQRRRENRDMHEMARFVEISATELTEALRNRDDSPYQTLLVYILSNLSSLFLSSNGRYSDWRFHLFKVLRHRPALLRKLKVAMCYPLDGIDVMENFDQLDCCHITHNFFFLPSLQELTLFELDLCVDPNPFSPFPQFRKFMYRTSTVEKLTISPQMEDDVCSYGTGEYLGGILQLPRRLVSLTLCMPFQRAVDPDRWQSLLTGDQLWQILYHSCDSLEYFDIYNAVACEDDDSVLKPNPNPPLGPLCDFKRLKTLRIQPSFLIGGGGGISPASFGLRDTLPKSLRLLTTYDSITDDESFVRNCGQFDEQLDVLLEDNFIPGLTVQRLLYTVNLSTILARPSLEKSLGRVLS